MGIVTAQWSPVNIRKHHFLSNLKESINTGIRNMQLALWIERNQKKRLISADGGSRSQGGTTGSPCL
jgi:hypothetical protein